MFLAEHQGFEGSELDSGSSSGGGGQAVGRAHVHVLPSRGDRVGAVLNSAGDVLHLGGGELESSRGFDAFSALQTMIIQHDLLNTKIFNLVYGGGYRTACAWVILTQGVHSSMFIKVRLWVASAPPTCHVHGRNVSIVTYRTVNHRIDVVLILQSTHF